MLTLRMLPPRLASPASAPSRLPLPSPSPEPAAKGPSSKPAFLRNLPGHVRDSSAEPGLILPEPPADDPSSAPPALALSTLSLLGSSVDRRRSRLISSTPFIPTTAESGRRPSSFQPLPPPPPPPPSSVSVAGIASLTRF
eukprot:1183375-Prorocentrum_minimum.AAC.2